MSEEFNRIETLLEQVKEYANTRIAQVKLSLAEKLSKTVAIVIAGIAAALVLFLFFVFAGIAAAIALGRWTGHDWLGFIIVAVIYLFFSLLLWKARNRLLTIPIMNALISNLFADEEEEDVHEKD